MLVMRLVLEQSSMVISTMGILLYEKVFPLYNLLVVVYVLNYIVYNTSLHIRSSDPTYVQNFRPVPLMVFEIMGFKLKNENDKKKN